MADGSFATRYRKTHLIFICKEPGHKVPAFYLFVRYGDTTYLLRSLRRVEYTLLWFLNLITNNRLHYKIRGVIER